MIFETSFWKLIYRAGVGYYLIQKTRNVTRFLGKGIDKARVAELDEQQFDNFCRVRFQSF